MNDTEFVKSLVKCRAKASSDAREYNEQRELEIQNYEGIYGRETIGNWILRHRIERTDDGLYVFYHATPKVSGAKKELRAGALLETDPEHAAFFAAKNRSLNPKKDIKVFKLELRPSQIEGSHWASLKEDVILTDCEKVRRRVH